MSAPAAENPEGWARLHPVTPILHAGQGVGILAVVLFSQFAPQGFGSDGKAAWIPLVGFLVALPVVAAMAYVAWRVNQYRVDDEAVHQRKGIVTRQYRQARLDRLQAVDVVQPLIARVFGFAELKVEVAGGRASGVTLRFLKLDQADALRNEIIALAAGVEGRDRTGVSGAGSTPGVRTEGEGAVPDATPVPAVRAPVAAAPAREVYRVPVGRLLGSIVASWWTLSIVLLIVAAITTIVIVGAVAVERVAGDAVSQGGGFWGFITGGAYGILPGIVAIFAIGWARFSSGFGFTAGVAADGIRLEHGLLDTRRQTVPPGRVQAIRLRQPLPWRRFDWWHITVNVAGYQDDQQAVSTLLPVGPRADALYALWLVLPDLGDPDPAGTVSRAMSGRGGDGGFTASPRRAWVVDPFQWRRRGVVATGRALFIRQGLLVRDLVVVPHEKTQSLAIRQGPLQRLLSLATIEVHSTRGSVAPVAQHLDLADAIALLEAQAKRAREARRTQTPEQWMATVQP